LPNDHTADNSVDESQPWGRHPLSRPEHLARWRRPTAGLQLLVRSRTGHSLDHLRSPGAVQNGSRRSTLRQLARVSGWCDPGLAVAESGSTGSRRRLRRRMRLRAALRAVLDALAYFPSRELGSDGCRRGSGMDTGNASGIDRTITGLANVGRLVDRSRARANSCFSQEASVFMAVLVVSSLNNLQSDASWAFRPTLQRSVVNVV